MIYNAKWIWADCSYEVNQYADFIAKINIDKVSQNAIMQISADTEYVVWINGQFAGCGQYDDYPDCKVFDTLHIGSLLKEGENRICVTAYYQGEASLQYAKGAPAVCFALTNFDDVLLSNEDVLSAKSKLWKSGEIHKTTNQLGFGYEYNAANDDNWLLSDDNTCNRFKNSVCVDFKTKLMPRPIKKLELGNPVASKLCAQGYFLRKQFDGTSAKLMYNDYLSHRRFEEMFDGKPEFPCELKDTNTQEGIYLIADLGKEESGYLTFELTAPYGTRVDVGYGEHLDDMRVRTEIKGRNFADTYWCKEGKNTFTYYFKRIAGRYIELHISSPATVVHYIGLIPARYPLDRINRFWSKDKLAEKIYDVSVETLRQCMHEHYEDCPWREQALYASDSRNQILAGYYAFGEYEFAKQSLRLLGESFGDDGIQSMCAPSDDPLKIPSFSMLWFLEVKDYTQYSGDDYFVRTMWDKIENAVSAFTAKRNDGIVMHHIGEHYWDFYEWSKGYMGIEEHQKYRAGDFVDGIYQVYIYIALDSALWLAQNYSKTDFYNKYKPVADELKKAINDLMWDEKKQLYASYKVNGTLCQYGQLMQSMAVYFGIAEGERAKALCDTLCNNDELVEITLSYSLYKYEALLKQGKEYYKYVFDEISEKWGNMIYKGSTTFWETSRGSIASDGAGSLCHGWSAIPVYYLSVLS